MPEAGYQQYCGLARALDVAGDRWTLLIVRELRLGARRFTDLVDGLPGISRKLLTDRLRALESDGVVVRQELPPPAARQVYALSDEGRELAEAMIPLVAWGARRLGERGAGESFRPQWAALAMAAFANSAAAAGVSETYQYHVGDAAFHFTLDDGRVDLHEGEAADPAAVLSTDEETWADIASGKITASDAAATGALTLTGDRRATKRLGKIFSRDHLLGRLPNSVRAGS